MKDDGVIIFDGDEPLLTNMLTKDKHKRIRVGWKEENDLIPDKVDQKGFNGLIFQVQQLKGVSFHLPLLGKHNIKNALYAIAVAQLFSLAMDEISGGLRESKMTGMRLEVNVVHNGMKVINDTYNSSPTSVRSSIETLLELEPTMEKWVLLGDMNELGEQEEKYHFELGQYIVTKKISRIYTIGNRGRWVAKAASRMNQDPSRVIKHFSTRASAAEELLKEGHHHVLLLVKSSRALQLEEVVTYLSKGRVE